MLATRIIPTLLCRGRQLVKGKQFNAWRSVGLAMQAARIHAMRGVDELALLDIGATPEGRGPDLDLVRELSECMFTPLAVGGGVRTAEDVKQLLRAGADKVVMGSAAMFATPLGESSAACGKQAIVAALDVCKGEVMTRCGTARAAPTWMSEYYFNGRVTPIEWALECEALGAGEILLTSIEREGMMQGYDLDLIRAVSDAVSIPVIAHGGCGTYAHMLEAIQAGASAVAAGALYQFTEATPAGAARYLHEHGVEVRLPNEVTA